MGKIYVTEFTHGEKQHHSIKANQVISIPAAQVAVKDSNTFYIVLNEYSDFATADKILKRFVGLGNNVMLATKDSVSFKLRMPFIKPISDTLKVKESLSKIFQVKAYVELP